MMVKLRPLFGPTAMMLPVVLVALALAGWQLERREWKRDILDRIAQNQAAPPLPFEELIKADPLRREYGPAAIAGTLLDDKEYYLAARNLKDEVGLHLVTPLQTDDGTIVLFDRGFVPSQKKDPKTRAAGKPNGRQTLIGIVRRTQEQRYFAPDNDPGKNFWFHVDVPLMRKLAGGTPDPVLDSFFLEADATPNPGGLPVGGQTRLDISNDHLQYAITWFLIALSGIGVYLAYHWENGRLTINGRRKSKP
jgi:surfeit locus 1 family protein